jgi:hypothetical protein
MINATFLFAVGLPLLFAACAYDSLVHRDGGISLPICFIYHVLRIGPFFMNFAYVYTLCHKEGHASVANTGLFAKPFDKKGPFRFVYNWWIGLFYGVMPASFAVGHSVNHHKYNNAEQDVVTTSDKPRDNVINFVAYLPRWTLYSLNISTIWQFISEGKRTTAWNCLVGSAYYSFWISACLRIFGARFTIGFVLYPFFENVRGLPILWRCTPCLCIPFCPLAAPHSTDRHRTVPHRSSCSHASTGRGTPSSTPIIRRTSLCRASPSCTAPSTSSTRMPTSSTTSTRAHTGRSTQP